MSLWIYPWNFYSESAQNLAKALGIKRIKHENSKLIGNKNKTVINWGASKLPDEVSKCNIINNSKSVSLCSNKLSFFREISGKASVPDWTNDPATAFQWVANGDTVCARTVLNGHSAEGLILMTKDSSTHVEAPLYTKYVPKIDEYRVHVVANEAIDIQRKALRPGWIEEHGAPNHKIRNLANGFIYVRNNLNPPAQVIGEAVKAVKAMGLDFGAVDVIWNQKRSTAYVLEINTAPGLEGTTLENYTNAFERFKK